MQKFDMALGINFLCAAQEVAGLFQLSKHAAGKPLKVVLIAAAKCAPL